MEKDTKKKTNKSVGPALFFSPFQGKSLKLHFTKKKKTHHISQNLTN